MQLRLFWRLVRRRYPSEFYVPRSIGIHKDASTILPLISPARAFLYNPLGSRCSTTSKGASTNTSTNGIPALSWISLAESRSFRYGEMNAVIVMADASANSFATYVDVSGSAKVPKKFSYLSYPTNIFISRFFIKAKVLVQTKSNVVTVEAV